MPAESRQPRGESLSEARAIYHPQGRLVFIAQAQGLISLLELVSFRTLDAVKARTQATTAGVWCSVEATSIRGACTWAPQRLLATEPQCTGVGSTCSCCSQQCMIR